MAMSKQRIVILADSLGMPRPDEGVNYEDSYAGIIAENSNNNVLCRAKRANDTKTQTQAQNLLDDVAFLKPNLCIIQLGIVDCAPRIFTKNEARALSLFPNKIRNFITKFGSKNRHRITKFRQICYVPAKKFESNYNILIKNILATGSRIILINIVDTSDTNNEKSFDFQNKITAYNQTIQKLATEHSIDLIDINNFTNSLLEDGIHINASAHAYIANELKTLHPEITH